jgi:hypothetical protein
MLEVWSKLLISMFFIPLSSPTALETTLPEVAWTPALDESFVTDATARIGHSLLSFPQQIKFPTCLLY